MSAPSANTTEPSRFILVSCFACRGETRVPIIGWNRGPAEYMAWLFGQNSCGRCNAEPAAVRSVVKGFGG